MNDSFFAESRYLQVIALEIDLIYTGTKFPKKEALKMDTLLVFLQKNTEIISFVLALFGGLAAITGWTDLISLKQGKFKLSKDNYSQKLETLLENLSKASKEVDSVLDELSTIAKEREASIAKLESGLASLEEQEKTLKKRVDELKDIPIPVAEHFASILEKGEKRSAYRDYLLFGLGVLLSTIISIVLRLIGFG
ncbi:MAG: aminoacyltransferase [Anaerolineales bacterium]|nr:aminoacyltransferase [Anaerolineales bacterium]